MEGTSVGLEAFAPRRPLRSGFGCAREGAWESELTADLTLYNSIPSCLLAPEPSVPRRGHVRGAVAVRGSTPQELEGAGECDAWAGVE